VEALMMISDTTQLAALDLAIQVGHGRRKLSKREAELHEQQIESIRQRILDFQRRSREREEQRRK
jgi:hypothetical protein